MEVSWKDEEQYPKEIKLYRREKILSTDGDIKHFIFRDTDKGGYA